MLCRDQPRTLKFLEIAGTRIAYWNFYNSTVIIALRRNILQYNITRGNTHFALTRFIFFGTPELASPAESSAVAGCLLIILINRRSGHRRRPRCRWASAFQLRPICSQAKFQGCAGEVRLESHPPSPDLAFPQADAPHPHPVLPQQAADRPAHPARRTQCTPTPRQRPASRPATQAPLWPCAAPQPASACAPPPDPEQARCCSPALLLPVLPHPAPAYSNTVARAPLASPRPAPCQHRSPSNALENVWEQDCAHRCPSPPLRTHPELFTSASTQPLPVGGCI
jgi:hypothetical protein